MPAPPIIAKFIQLRPCLYHLTASANIARIAGAFALECAEALLRAGGAAQRLAKKRPELVRFQIDSDSVVIRDQAPLHEGNTQLEGGWSYEDVLRAENQRVFFWPGTLAGPNAYGRRHFARYANERPSPGLLRIDTAALFDMNPDVEFCRYNSGSPRCSAGKRSPRGPGTFVSAASFPHPPSAVVEVTFRHQVQLPRRETHWRPMSVAAWRLLDAGA